MDDEEDKDDGLEDIFSTRLIPLSSNEEAATDDFEFARQNIRAIIEQAGPAFQHLLANIDANNGSNPLQYEALKDLLANLVEANRQLLEINRMKTDIDIKQGKMTVLGSQTGNTNIFLQGTTTDLAKAVQQLLDKPKEDDKNN